MLGPEPPALKESKFRFLYVGNDLKLIAKVSKALTLPDYQMVTCGDSGGAEMFLKSEIDYHLLVIDYEWREGEGLKLADLAKSLSHRKRMPVILAVAAPVTSVTRTAAGKAGVKTLVTKSANMRAITDAVRQLVES